MSDPSDSPSEIDAALVIGITFGNTTSSIAYTAAVRCPVLSLRADH